MKIRIKDIKIGNRYRKNMGNIQELADSIKEQGLLQSIGIDKNNLLVFGQRRLGAVKLLGWQEVDVRIVNVTSLLEGELTENEVRKQFDNDERVAIGRAVEELIGRRQGQRTDIADIKEKQLGETFPQAKKEILFEKPKRNPRTRDIAAEKAGFGTGRNYDKAKLVSEKATPKQKERLNAGKSSINAIYKEVKRVDKKEEIKRIPQEKLVGKYNVFLADPPWQYDQTSTSIRGVADDHYPTMNIEELKALPIKDIILDDAVLFLWTTTSMIRKAFDIIEAWGFEFKTSMVWVKQHIGTGFYVRSKHEIILIGIKGHFLPMTMDIPESVFFAEKSKHSKKPEIIYEIIEKMYPNQRFLEIFHRGEKRSEWAQWGNESGL